MVGVAALLCAAPALPQPQGGEIRVWGSPADRKLLGEWERGFQKLHPGARFSESLHGPESTIAGVYTGVADLGLMAREIRLPVEKMAFEWVHRYAPFLVEVANAGLRPGRPSANLAIIVHRDNPLSRLDLAQLDGILGAEHKRGHPNVRRWGDLGLQGEWQDRAIHLYGPAVDSIPALHLRTVVMRDSHKWNPDYRELGGDREIVDAVARDPAGIGYAPLPSGAEVKALELCPDACGRSYALTAENVKSRAYPLSRVISVVLDRAPGKPVPPKLKEFLRYILSAEGQAAVMRDGAYIPLSVESAKQQLARLDAPAGELGVAPSRERQTSGTQKLNVPPSSLRQVSAAEKLGMPTPSAQEQVSGAEKLDWPPPYVPAQQVSGTIRIWGHGAYAQAQDFIEGLTRAWEEGFRRHQPRVSFENRLHGTASAIGALYTGTGDLALMGREIWPIEIDAFKEVFHYPPTGVDVVTGSFDVRNRGYAIVVFVHQDNPLSKLTLAQLDAIYSADRRRGGRPVRTWGDLGADGEWRDKPVHRFGLPIARGFADYLEQVVFLGGRKWNPELREFADQPGSKGGATDGGQQLLDALAKDPLAIGYAGLVYRHPEVKPIALAEREGGPFVAPTKENVLNHSYPLIRMITMFFNRPPGKAVDPRLKEFLHYILSAEGQQAVLREGQGYLPMLAPFARRELQKLEN